MTIEVDLGTVLRASAIWDDQAEQLRGATNALTDIDPASSVGPGAVAALTTYLDHWSTRLLAMSTTSRSHADALDTAAVDLTLADRAAAESIVGLLAR